MKNNFLLETNSNSKIRQNRLRMKQSLKLQFIQHQQKNMDKENEETEAIPSKKSQFHLKVLNVVGLVQKEYIHGQFEDAYDLKEKIGEGAHASVYRCIQKSTGKEFAVKITKHGDEELIQGAKIQYKILKNLDHENVMKAESFYTDTTKMTTYLVCELCNYPELRVHLRNRTKQFLSEAQATTIIMSLLQTLQYLHRKGVCHRDIKPENILYDSQSKSLKVIDFDCSKDKKPSDSKFEMWTKTGSLCYQAPEYFEGAVYDEKVDLWALGVIAYELVTGEPPFKSFYYNRMIKLITEEQVEIDGLNISDDFKQLLRKLLEKNPSKRYSASQCLRLPLILKHEHMGSSKMFDDFDVELMSTAHSSPRSCSDLDTHRIHETSTCGDDSSKSLLKYCIFVGQI